MHSQVNLNLDLLITRVCYTTVHHGRIAAIKAFIDRYLRLVPSGAEYVVLNEELQSFVASPPVSLISSSEGEVPILLMKLNCKIKYIQSKSIQQ